MVHQRKLTSDERKSLQRNGATAERRDLFGSYLLLFIALVAMCFLGISIVWEPLSRLFDLPERNEIKWWLFLACFLSVFFFLLTSIRREFQHFKAPSSYANLIDADLAAGLAFVEILDVNEVYEIEEFEDEGAGFLLSLADGRVFCIVGQDLYPYSLSADREDKKFAETVFPNTKIEHTYAPNSEFVFGTTGLGDHLRPTAVLRWPERGPRLDQFWGPTPDSFLDGPVEDIIKKAEFTQESLQDT